MFRNLHDQRATRLADANIAKQTGIEQTLRCRIDVGVGKRLARRDAEVIANCLRIHTRVSADFNGKSCTVAACAADTAATVVTIAPELTRAADMASADAAPTNFELAAIGLLNLCFSLSPGQIPDFALTRTPS